MEPVRIKLYGLFSRTRKQFVSQQVTAAFLAVPLLAIWLYLPRPDVPETPPTGSNPTDVGQSSIELAPDILLLIGLLDKIPWIVLAILAALAVETVIVLRMFKRKEAEQNAAAAPIKPV